MTEEALEKLKYPIGDFEYKADYTDNDLSGWKNAIALFPRRIQKMASNLSGEELNYKYRPGGWTIQQLIHHCADSHMNAFVRIKLMLTEDQPTIKPYFEDRWADMKDVQSVPIQSSLAILDGLHARWSAVLENLVTNELKRTYFHPETKSEFSLEKVIALYAWHSDHHLAHLEQAIKYQGKFN